MSDRAEKFIGARHHAREISDSALAAYWDKDREAFHEANMRSSMEQLAAHLGYRLDPMSVRVATEDADLSLDGASVVLSGEDGA